MLDEDVLAGPVARELAVQLRHGDVALVDDEQPVVGEVVEQRVGRLTCGTPVQVAAVVLDPVAASELGQHLEIVLGAHPEPLRLEQLARLLELTQALAQLDLDRGDGMAGALVAGDVVGGREDDQLLEIAEQLAGQHVEPAHALDLVAEQLDAHRVLLVGGVDLDRVASHPEPAPDEIGVVALVVHVDKTREQGTLVVRLTGREHEDLPAVLLGRAEAVDARHRRHDDDVSSREQARRRRVAQPVYLVVDRRVLLDVGVRRREVGLGLVVVVVGDEVLDPVVGEEAAELSGELCRERLVGREHKRGTLHLLDGPGDRGALAAPGYAEQGLEAVPPGDATRERLYRGWLRAGRLEVRNDAELGHLGMVPRGCALASGGSALGHSEDRRHAHRDAQLTELYRRRHGGARRVPGCCHPHRPSERGSAPRGLDELEERPENDPGRIGELSRRALGLRDRVTSRERCQRRPVVDVEADVIHPYSGPGGPDADRDDPAQLGRRPHPHRQVAGGPVEPDPVFVRVGVVRLGETDGGRLEVRRRDARLPQGRQDALGQQAARCQRVARARVLGKGGETHSCDVSWSGRGPRCVHPDDRFVTH